MSGFYQGQMKIGNFKEEEEEGEKEEGEEEEGEGEISSMG